MRARAARLTLVTLAFLMAFAIFANVASAASTYFEQYPAVGGSCADTMPRISVKVSDPAGISGGYQLKIDGASKTPKTKWGPGNAYVELYYQVSSAMANGPHTIYASVLTGAGRTSTTWTYNQRIAPVIGPLTPADGSTVNSQKPTISAVVNTGANGLGSYTMAVDGTAVSPTYDSATKTVSYTPLLRLANGQTHTVTLTATDSTGVSTTVTWGFVVQIYASMVDTQGCTDCHSTYPNAHPMSNCMACHDTNAPFPAYWNMDDPAQYAHIYNYLYGTDCAYCHASQFPNVPRHPDNIGDAHQSATDMSGCSCHVADLTVEHNRYLSDSGAQITCATCHLSSDPQIQAGMAKGTRLCADCHTISGNHPYGDIDHVADVGEISDLSGKKCGECHDMDLLTEHERPSSSSAGTSCGNCHEFSTGAGPGDTLNGWNQTCTQGGCHAAGSATAMHANQSSAHVPTSESSACTGAGCHSFTDVAALHSEAATEVAGAAVTSCSVCHRNGVTLTKDCATCHPDRLDPHGYDAVQHTATDTASLACAAAGCHDTAEAMPIHSELGCKTCHAHPTKGDLVAGKARFACVDCHVAAGTDYHIGWAAKHRAPAADYDTCGHCHHGWGSGPGLGPDITRHTSCATCHNSTMNLTGKTAHCADCHQNEGAGAKPTYYHQSVVARHSPQDTASLGCARCHETTNVYALHGADGCATCHATYGCTECHRLHNADPNTPLLRNVSCSKCHTTEGTNYHANFTASHTYSAMDAGCQGSGCHSSSLVTAHAAFVGTGGRYPQYADTCALCHLNTNATRIPADATSACGSCHGEGHGDLTALHTSSTQCYGTCHTNRIDTTAHVPSCGTCHQSTTARVTSAVANHGSNCAACHRAGSGYVDANGQAYLAVGAVHDGVQPAITNVTFSYTSSPAAPVVTWTTDRPCTTYVDYTGPDWSYDGENYSGYTATAGNATLSTTHSVSFPAASASSSSGYYYYYRIRTVDAQGNVAVSNRRIYHRNRSANTAYYPYGFEPDYGSVNTDVVKLAVIKTDGSRIATGAIAGWESQTAAGTLPDVANPGTAVSAATLTTATVGNYYSPSYWRTKLATTDGSINWQVTKFQLDQSAVGSMQGLLVDWYGYAENSAGHPLTVYVWNFDNAQWERMDTRQSTGDSAYIKVVESTSAAQSYCLRCHSTPISASVTMPSNLANMRVSWNTDFHGAGKGSGYGGTLKAPYSRGQAAIDCDVCHDPAAHGSAANPYKLKSTVNGSAVSVTNGTTSATLCVACHEGTPNDFHAQCISCHQSFVPDYHNDTGNAPMDFTGADCLSCHKHGKTDYAPGCHSCHNYPSAGPYTTF